jgi:hypothetical protein
MATERESTARNLSRDPRVTFRWHSMSCTCNDCLNSDAIVYMYGYPVANNVMIRVDMSGLTLDPGGPKLS